LDPRIFLWEFDMNRPAFSARQYPEHEIARIQRELDRLKSIVDQNRVKERHETTEAEVRAVLWARRQRELVLGKELFSDPAWDILLELYAAALGQRRVPTSELSIAAGIPLTTTLRWISKLESDGLVTRADDPLDGRRVWIALANQAVPMMSSYFNQVAAQDRLV
jgi:DNA-binding transcriptional ArsR family regulator